MWPELALVRNRTGRPELVAASRRAVIFRECMGFTRGSLAPVKKSTAG